MTAPTETPAGVSAAAASQRWLEQLSSSGASRDAAVAELHALLLKAARFEVNRRRASLPHLRGGDHEDLAQQSADDALVAVLAKLGQFRGESRFTTWAYKFAIFEVSAKVGRHFWRRPQLPYDTEDWEALPDRFGFDAADEAEARELVAALRTAVDEQLSERQRTAFVAIVLNGVPADALAAKVGSNRNAIYKTLFDARHRVEIDAQQIGRAVV